MFLGQIGERLQEDAELLKMKVQLKIDRQYSDIGKIPGVIVDESKRRKVLKDLGLEVPARNLEEEKKEATLLANEPKIENVPPTAQPVAKAITYIENDKNDANKKIPEKYRASNTSTALSLVNALASN